LSLNKFDDYSVPVNVKSMTLIAMALSGRPPIMTADILITSIEGEADMRLPNRPIPLSKEDVQYLSYKPNKLQQKL
jgi:hypothetical protein